jgi:hypothetical protein
MTVENESFQLWGCICDCFYKIVFFDRPLMVFRQRILFGPASGAITCSLQRPVSSRLANSRLNESRKFIVSAYRPISTTGLVKPQFSVNQQYYKLIARSKATAVAGRPEATGRSSENAAGWNTITLWQSGITRPQPVEISREARTIRGDEKTMQVFHLCTYYMKRIYVS